MMAVATAAVAIDGLDPVLLVPMVCIIVGLVLGILLGLGLREREVERYRRRAEWLASALDAAHDAHGVFIRQVMGWLDEDDAKAKSKRRTCTSVEVPE